MVPRNNTNQKSDGKRARKKKKLWLRRNLWKNDNHCSNCSPLKSPNRRAVSPSEASSIAIRGKQYRHQRPVASPGKKRGRWTRSRPCLTGKSLKPTTIYHQPCQTWEPQPIAPHWRNEKSEGLACSRGEKVAVHFNAPLRGVCLGVWRRVYQ